MRKNSINRSAVIVPRAKLRCQYSQAKVSVLATLICAILGHTPALAAFTPDVVDKVVTDEVLDNRNIQTIGSHGTANNSTINMGGLQHIVNGGTANNTTINGMPGSGINGGIQTVIDGGITHNTTINGKSSQVVNNGGTANKTIINEGHQEVNNGGIANDTTVKQFGLQTVAGGGIANNTTIEHGGYQYISNRGITNNTTINANGAMSVYNGGIITGKTIINSLGVIKLGSGYKNNLVYNEGELIFQRNGSYILDFNLTSTGGLTQNGPYTLTLSTASSYTGATTVNGGIIKAGADNVFSASSDYMTQAAGTLDLDGYNQTLQSLNNSGTVNFGGIGGNTLTVTGDYIGSNGLLNMNSVLEDDDSVTDKLIIAGNTSGNTYVQVNNLGGSGAQTLNGIELITVGGVSNGEFTQQGRIVAGAYDYYLQRGAGSNAANWYLSNAIPTMTPTPGVPPIVESPETPEAPEAPEALETPETLETPEAPVTPETSSPMVERPEASGYSANLAAANNMFVTRLHDRLGETQYIDALTGEQKVTSLWLRNEGGHNRSRDSQDQLRTQSNRYVMQLGGDIAQWSSSGQDRFHLGLMAGYGNSKSTSESRLSGYSARASVDGYSTGVYGTWYANSADKTGLYIDSWAQYSWFNNTVNGQGLATEEYKSKGVTASVESGYTFKVGENAAKNASYFIQPKAQVTWMGVKADEHKEANGTHVSGEGNGNIQTRLGVKAFMNGYAEQDKGKDRAFQPFVEANWIHNTKDFGTTMDGITVKQDGAANIAELKLGVEGQLSKQVNLWGNVGQQVGNKGYSDTAVMLGVKYNF
ncbi:autotransporter outer membrane beta-barrel domain-containing protein [Yersinia frederiksenii]|uniref:autotransporter outer membrane beta-barrel domain-containing protein n=1 Tax=Yersinia frederiksenii TaxID=29484 RepID=UPI0025AA4696|nr:autotransporter outer membrane beta-barrel domain-containing protein [Yersinia frederiksenii]MDN0121089.1 autotransporter outer membrane beta-barrel domain-containing protein [Yersinia frederiksenii]